MKVLVTGGSGYIGKKLVKRLSQDNEVSQLDRTMSSKGDIRGELDLSAYDTIFHLAAVSSPALVEKDHVEAWDVNVNGTWNIARRLKSGQRMVFISSAQVYDRRLSAPHAENELPSPVNFYGLTKLVGEQLVAYHARSAGFRHVVLRLFNVYSADQPKGLLIGDVMEKYKGAGPVEISNPRTTLDMVHADDAVKVISEAPGFDEGIYNVSTGRPISVGEIYAKVKSKVKGAESKKETVVSDKSYTLLGDNSKLRSLGYSFREFSLD